MERTCNMNPVIVFDGVCNFCNAAVNFVIEHDKAHYFRFAALQSDFGQQIGAEHLEKLPPSGSIMLVDGNAVYYKSDAVLHILKHLSGWSWLYAGRWVPAVVRNWLYDVVARHRYLILGRRDACRIPTAQERSLFLS